ALGGGWLISWGALRPLKKIMKMTSRIADANDLSMRLNIHKGPKEVRRLARNFDSMLDRLEKSFEEEKQFTSDASHELRTPVAVILAECERAKKRERTAEDYKESLGYIEDRAKRMKRIVAELLNITRLSLKADKYPLLEADLSSYVSDCIYEFVPADTRGITLETDIEEDLSVNCNLFLISGLVGNLVQNAYKYGKEGGHVWVSLKRVQKETGSSGKNKQKQKALQESAGILLSVRDDGIGIAMEDQERVFNRFFRVDPSRSDIEGTGLGLSIVKEIADIHGATVSLKSRLGEGSEFAVRFPENPGEREDEETHTKTQAQANG
ncbi:MAG: HAMP domain-containing histidine kinase, partial [Lachnospiraceae bacterium]|nr:HAMP domain-containing histidine kinase [Lachnospiraceae bacterium]